jgi:hypothetical protein
MRGTTVEHSGREDIPRVLGGRPTLPSPVAKLIGGSPGVAQALSCGLPSSPIPQSTQGEATPTTATTESFGVTLTDTSTSSTISQTYTIAITTPTPVTLINFCGYPTPDLSIFSVAIANVGGTKFTQTVNTDSNGNYTFIAVPNGTYTITPALTNSGSTVLFYPATL